MMLLIAGGTGAGKSALATAVAAGFGRGARVVAQDHYWRPRQTWRTAKPWDGGSGLFDMPRCWRDLCQAQRGASLVIFEGLLALGYPRLRAAAGRAVWLEVPDELRLWRRLRRDVVEWGRVPLAAALDHWLAEDKPWHDHAVLPTRRYADLLLHGGQASIAALATRVLQEVKA